MPRRRPRVRIPLLLAFAAVVVTIAAYVFGLSQYQASNSTLFTARDLYIPRTIDVVIALWCFWVGSSIGSFLNVVAWRVPRGESINGRSHCPRCRAQLKARDNFPVFGWLALGGRCRTCHLPISPRYPIVEAIVGLTITLVAVGELYQLSLPRQATHWHGGPFWAPVVDGPVLLTLLYHVVGLSACWALGLIRMDNHRLPGRLMAFAFAAAIVPMLAYPTLMVVPWQMKVGEVWRPDGLYVDALVRIVSALAAATLLARCLARGLCPAADPKLDPLGRSTARLIDLIAILAIPTIIVGWQASPAVTVLASLIAVALRDELPKSDALGRFAIAMPIALTAQLVLWRNHHALVDSGSDRLSYWPSDGASPWVILVWSALVLLIPFWLRDPPAVKISTTGESAEPVNPKTPSADDDTDVNDCEAVP